MIHKKSISNLPYFPWKWFIRKKRRQSIFTRSTQRLYSNKSSSYIFHSIDGISGLRLNLPTWSKYMMRNSLSSNKVLQSHHWQKRRSPNSSMLVHQQRLREMTLKPRHLVPLEQRTREALEYSIRFTIILIDRIKKKRSRLKENNARSRDCFRVEVLASWTDQVLLRITIWTQVREMKNSSRNIKTIKSWMTFKNWTCLSSHLTIGTVDRGQWLIHDLSLRTKSSCQPKLKKFCKEVRSNCKVVLWQIR